MNDHSITPLMRAAIEEDRSTLEKLLKSPNIDMELFIKDRKGRTALHWARMSRNYKSASIIISSMLKSVDHDIENSAKEIEKQIIITNQCQSAELFKAVKARRPLEALQVIKDNKLVRSEVEEAGENFFTNFVGPYGYTPLILASGFNLIDVVEALLELETPVDDVNKFGHTAFTFACAVGNSEVARLLLFHGAYPHHQTNEGRSGLHYACQYGKAKTVKVVIDFLLERFAMYRIESHSLIDFDYTRWTTYADILERLIQLRDNRGKTALEVLPDIGTDTHIVSQKLIMAGVKHLGDWRSLGDEFSLMTNKNHSDDISDLSWEDAAHINQMLGSLLPAAAPLLTIDSFNGEDESEQSNFSLQTDPSKEENWSHDTDNMHAVHIKDAHSITTALPLSQEIASIKDQFERVKERINVWLTSAEKEKDLVTPIPCPLECGFICKVEDLTSHVTRDCPFRQIQCEQCHKLTNAVDMDKHLRRSCPKRIVACPNAYSGCRELITADSIDAHIHMRCKLRMMLCRQFCGALIPFQAREGHENLHCRNRVVTCDMCSDQLVANEYPSHLKQTCRERQVRCSVSCGEFFKAKDIPHHEQEVCIQPCRWGCGERVGPVEQRRLHEITMCKSRPCPCRHPGCKVKGLTAHVIEQHQEEECDHRPIPCPHVGCCELVKAKDLFSHMDSWEGRCRMRNVRCPSNLVGWKVEVRVPMNEVEEEEGEPNLHPDLTILETKENTEDDNEASISDGFEWKEAILLQFKRQVSIENSQNSSHPSPEDWVFLRFEDKQIWVKYWETTLRPLKRAIKKDPAGEEFICGWVIRADSDEHLDHDCCNRNVFLAADADQRVGLAGQQATLRTSHTVARLRRRFDQFLNTVEQPEEVFCELCTIPMPRDSVPQHQREDCQECSIRCSYGCGESMLRKVLHAHLQEACGKRNVLCSLCGRTDVWAEELDGHRSSKCPRRIVPCPLFCDVTDLEFINITSHCEKDCARRLIICECKQKIEARELPDHQRLYCDHRFVDCPQGCGSKVRFCEKSYHFEHECKNQTFKYQQYMACPNGCGIAMMKRDILHHVSYECERRMVECPLHCGNSIPVDRIKDHMIFCPRRVIPCEPGMKCCSRELHAWLHRETEIEQQRTHDPTYTYHRAHTHLMPRRRFREESVASEESQSVNEYATPIGYEPSANSLFDTEYTESYVTGSEHYGSAAGTNSLITYESPTGYSLAVNAAETTAYQDELSHSAESQHYGEVIGSPDPTNTESYAASSYPSVTLSGTANGSHGLLSVASSQSSVYLDGFQMRLHHELRMNCCTRHGTSIMMAALRHQDLSLAEHLSKNLKQSEDIDFENQYGDTALTLACRMGHQRFVEFLVQNSAAVNKETFNGKTALIEATRAPEENIAIIDYLIDSGCVVDFKTARHGHTALQWAKRLKRKKSIRILDLAAQVQKQAIRMLNAISTGDFDYVHNLIKEGDFFDANGEAKYYVQMGKYAAMADTAEDDLEEVEKRMEGLPEGVDQARTKVKEAKEELQGYLVEQKKAFKAEDVVNRRITVFFTAFEKAALKLQRAEIEEIIRLQSPGYVVRLAVFIYGIMFELLDPNEWSDVHADLNSSKIWWPVMTPHLIKSLDALRKLQAFTIAKLEGIRMIPLIPKASLFLTELMRAIYDELLKQQLREEQESDDSSVGSSRGSFSRQSSWASTGFASPSHGMLNRTTSSRDFESRGTTPPPLSKFRSQASMMSLDTVQSMSMTEADTAVETVDETAGEEAIPVEEWDSDAEDAWDGYWEKGEWVAVKKTRENWWERRKNKDPKQSEEEMKPSESYLNLPSIDLSSVEDADKKKKSNKFVYISNEMIEQQVKMVEAQYKRNTATPAADKEQLMLDALVNGTADLDYETITRKRPKSKSSRVKSSRGKSRKNKRGKNKHGSPTKGRQPSRQKSVEFNSDINHLLEWDVLEGVSMEDLEGYQFVSTIIQQLKAIVRFSMDRKELSELKKNSSDCSQRCEDCRTKCNELQEVYQQAYEKQMEVEKEVIAARKKVRHLNGRVKIFRERVRIARLMNMVAVNGHTAISWAASHGAYEVVEDMLTHGATVGFPAPLLHQTATYLQLSYQIYKKYVDAKYKKPKGSMDPGEGVTEVNVSLVDEEASGHARMTDIENETARKANALRVVKEIQELKYKREKILAALKFQRGRLRMPIPEAVYAGKWEIVSRIYERRLFHVYFSNTWVFPSPPPPRISKFNRTYEHDKLTITDVLTHAMNDNAAGAYLPETGWVGANDPSEPFGELHREITRILEEMAEKRSAFLANRYRIRLLANERRNQREGEKEMAVAVVANDFRRCIYLARRRGITIDLETEEGFTVLLGAAEENVDSVNHKFMQNDDGRMCLAVEYLLDREYYRPSIDLENKFGHTALIRACSLKRAHVVEALLDRGADINYINKFGRTALHTAAAVGSTECARILMERFADKTIKDPRGLTAYDIAEKENFTSVMRLLSQFRGGYLGPVQLSRGRVNNTIGCPLGCGTAMFPHEVEDHCKICLLRNVPCPNNCGDSRLMAREIDSHLAEECVLRVIQCPDCREEMEQRRLEHHQADLCTHRIVPCSLECGRSYPFYDLSHEKTCNWRPIPCSLLCDQRVQYRQMEHHVKNECENRRVPCPLRCRGLVVFKLISEHLSTVCPRRPGNCSFCEEEMPRDEIEDHQKVCSARKEMCPNKCGELVTASLLASHLKDCCNHRLCLCSCSPLCGRKIRAINLKQHEAKECEYRLIPCEYGCLQQDNNQETFCLPARQISVHLKHECKERPIRCRLCEEVIKAKDITSHEKDNCPLIIVSCGVSGCEKKMPFRERDNHERHECRFRSIPCPQACGELVVAIHAGNHMSRTCEMRQIDCPLYCGVKLRAKDLQDHWDGECIRKISTPVAGTPMLFSRASSSRLTPSQAAASWLSDRSGSPGWSAPGSPATGVLKRAPPEKCLPLNKKINVSKEVGQALQSLGSLEDGTKMRRKKVSSPAVSFKEGKLK